VLMQDLLASLMHDFKIFVNTHYLKISGLREMDFFSPSPFISRKKCSILSSFPPYLLLFVPLMSKKKPKANRKRSMWISVDSVSFQCHRQKIVQFPHHVKPGG